MYYDTYMIMYACVYVRTYVYICTYIGVSGANHLAHGLFAANTYTYIHIHMYI